MSIYHPKWYAAMGIFVEHDICQQRPMDGHAAFLLRHNVLSTTVAAIYCDCAVRIDDAPINGIIP